MSGVTDTAEMKLLREAEALAVKAQAIHKKVEGFEARFVALGRDQLAAAIEAGQYLVKAKKILGHGNFTEEQKRWRINRTITFSERSGRRYMRLATHAEAIKSAKLANINEAEKYVGGLETVAETQGAAKNKSSPPSGRKEADAVEQCEARIINEMRRLDSTSQRSFLKALITRLNERFESLPQ